MSNDRLIIKEDITDWRDEALREELIIEGDDDIFEAFKSGVHSSKLARAVVVSREMEKAPLDIIPANKALIECGSQSAIAQKISNRTKKERLENGTEVEVAEYLGRGNVLIQNVDAGEDVVEEAEYSESVNSGPSYYPARSQGALDSSLRYLSKTVPGWIRNQLAYVAINGGNVQEEADKLKNIIDEIVERLV